MNEGRVRVCKLFFINTLDINDRPIRTVLEKKNKVCENLIENDLRGKHSNHHTVDQSIKDGMRAHIDSIPKIESHYLRANTSRVFIDGSKTVADIHRDYVSKCKENNAAFGNYSMFYKVFTEDYNISFSPRKKINVAPAQPLKMQVKLKKIICNRSMISTKLKKNCQDLKKLVIKCHQMLL